MKSSEWRKFKIQLYLRLTTTVHYSVAWLTPTCSLLILRQRKFIEKGNWKLLTVRLSPLAHTCHGRTVFQSLDQKAPKLIGTAAGGGGGRREGRRRWDGNFSTPGCEHQREDPLCAWDCPWELGWRANGAWRQSCNSFVSKTEERKGREKEGGRKGRNEFLTVVPTSK